MTTKPSLFWIDPGEFSFLLERAGASNPAIVAKVPTAHIKDAAHIKDQVNEENNHHLTAPPPVGKSPQDNIPQGPLEERLSALLTWVRSVVEFDHAFVVDGEGLALVHQESAPLELIAASAEMSETWEALRHRFDLATENFISARLLDHRQLHVLTAKTEWGRVSLGLVLQAPIPTKDVTLIHEQFQRTLDEKEHNQL